MIVVIVYYNLSCFLLGINIGGPDPEVGKLGCEGWKQEAQKCFMKNLFVRYQNQPNCHRWQLFGRWCGGNLFVWSICLLWWSLRGRNPPTQLAFGSRVAGGQVIQRRSVMGSSLSPPRVGGCANLVTDGFVWLPCPALLKSPCPETIHQNPSTPCLRTKTGRIGYRDEKDYF